MLSIFLCTGRSAHIDDFTYAVPSPTTSQPPRKKLSLNGKRKITKLEIGAPSDFRHYTHMGYEEVAGLDMDKYEQAFQMRMAQQAPLPTSAAAPNAANNTLPRSMARYAGGAGPVVSPPRRKPVPAPSSDASSLGENASAPPSPTTRHPRRPRQPSNASSTHSGIAKPLVPLLPGKAPDSPNQRYVTQTAKLRFDDALTEIERALREPR